MARASPVSSSCPGSVTSSSSTHRAAARGLSVCPSCTWAGTNTTDSSFTSQTLQVNCLLYFLKLKLFLQKSHTNIELSLQSSSRNVFLCGKRNVLLKAFMLFGRSHHKFSRYIFNPYLSHSKFAYFSSSFLFQFQETMEVGRPPVLATTGTPLCPC